MWLVIGFAIVGIIVCTIFNIVDRSTRFSEYFLGVLIGVLLGALCGLIISAVGSLICQLFPESIAERTESYELISCEINDSKYYAILEDNNKDQLSYSVKYFDDNDTVNGQRISGKVVSSFNDKQQPTLKIITYSLNDYLSPWFFMNERYSYEMILPSPDSIYVNSNK